jgi:hypothetical protein
LRNRSTRREIEARIGEIRAVIEESVAAKLWKGIRIWIYGYRYGQIDMDKDRNDIRGAGRKGERVEAGLGGELGLVRRRSVR